MSVLKFHERQLTTGLGSASFYLASHAHAAGEAHAHRVNGDLVLARWAAERARRLWRGYQRATAGDFGEEGKR